MAKNKNKKTKDKNAEKKAGKKAAAVEEQVTLEAAEEIADEVTEAADEAVEVEAADATAEEPGEEAPAETPALTLAPAVDGLVTDINEIESAVLALIFASPTALTAKRIKNLLTHGGYDTSQLELVLESLPQMFEQRGIQVAKVASGFQVRTNPKYAEVVQKLVEEKPQRLSKSALEVLSIIAYKQPITRADIDHVRGTDSGHLLKSLLEKNLVRTEGHKETAGRPLLYGTTTYFLEVFTLASLDDLPAIEEFERELQDANVDGGMEGAGLVLDADPGFFDKPSALDADADRGEFDGRAEDVVEKADFGVEERAAEEVAEQSTTH